MTTPETPDTNLDARAPGPAAPEPNRTAWTEGFDDDLKRFVANKG